MEFHSRFSYGYSYIQNYNYAMLVMVKGLHNPLDDIMEASVEIIFNEEWTLLT